MSHLLNIARLGRLHSASFTVIVWVTATFLGGAQLYLLLIVVLVAIVEHLGTFGMGGIADIEYDLKDPAKARHPLVTKVMTMRQAWAVVAVGQAVPIAFILYLSQGHFLYPVLFLVVYHVAGWAYIWDAKNRPALGAVTSTVAFSSMFLMVTTAFGGHLTILALLVALYLGVAGGISGCEAVGAVKDLDKPWEKNLLRDLGTKLEGEKMTMSPASWGFVVALIAMKAGLLVVVTASLWDSSIGLAVGALIGAMAYYQTKLFRSGPFDRKGRMKVLGLAEAGSYLLLVVVLAPKLGWIIAPFLLIFPLLFFAVSNRLVWKETGSSVTYGA